MEEMFDEVNVGPQYPAELYTKRPNDTALLSPLNDFTFKSIFTQETEESNLALKSFISVVLNRAVLSVSLKSNEPYKETSKQKSMFFDVSVEFNDGEIADLEMQARNQGYNFGTRAEIQTARMLSNNAKKGGKKWKAKNVYQISVLNFHYKEDDKKEMRWYTMKDETGETLSEKLNVIFIDLVSIRQNTKHKPLESLSSIEKWGLFFSYVDHHDKEDYIKNIVSTEEGIMAADKTVRKISKQDSNWFTQNSIWVAERDRSARMEYEKEKMREQGLQEGRQQGLQEGRQQGLQQGLQQGSQQKAEEIAINLLKIGLLSNEQIAQSSGLSIEKVLELNTKMS